MLPQPLINVYREYKKDTNIVASWLALTARECGYTGDILDTPAPQQDVTTSGRPKGKARTGGKKKSNKKGKGHKAKKASPAQVSKYVIATKDFVPLAECISASNKPALSIPQAFSNSLSRVIAVRSAFGEMLTKHGAEPDAESDKKHSYFVGILKKVREVLKNLMPSTEPKPSDPVGNLTNAFSVLEVYEPSEAFLNAPDVEKPQSTAQENIIYEAEPPQSLEDALIAFWMMLRDLDEIRNEISRVWSLLPTDTGKRMDPACLAVATNTGLDFARDIIEDMLPIFEPHGGVFAMCKLYFESTVLEKGQSAEDFNAWMAQDRRNNAYSIASQCYFYTASLLNTLALVPFNGNVSIYPDDAFGVYNPEGTWDSKTQQEKFKEDTVLLTELFWEGLTIAHHVPDYPVVDEFIRGIKEFKETNEISFSFIFAAQITLDIHHVIRGFAETSVETLVMRLNSMNAHLQSCIGYHENVKSPHWSPSNERVLKQTQEGFDWFLEDPPLKAKALIAGRKGRAVVSNIKKHRLLRRSPIVAGLALYYFRTDMYETGIAFTNAWGTIILSAHLYNAALKEGFMTSRWHDMGLLFHEIGIQQFFVGGRPEDPQGYLRRFLLQIGTSASFFTDRGRRSYKVNPDIFSRGKPRFLKPNIPTTNRFMDRYWKNTGSINWTPEDIMKILSIAPPRNPKKPLATQNVGDASSKTAERSQISPAQLMGSLFVALSTEIEKFAFLYMMMHRITWQTIKIIMQACNPFISESFGVYTEHEWSVPFNISYILGLAAGLDGEEDLHTLNIAGVSLSAMAGVLNSSSANTMIMRQLSGRDYSTESPYEKS